MAITQEKSIEMLEKLPDGNFKIKYPKTKAGQVIEETNKKFMTDAERTKLSGIAAGAQVNTVTSVAGKTGAVTLSKSDVGLNLIPNYGVATTAQAQAGTSDSVLMTALKVAQAIASLAARVVTGTYTGNGSSVDRLINIGVTPKVIIVSAITDAGSTIFTIGANHSVSSAAIRATAAISHNPSGDLDIRTLKVTTNGFYVRENATAQTGNGSLNDNGITYEWTAII